MITIQPKAAKIYQKAADAAWQVLGLSGDALVEFSLVGEKKIRKLNKDFREKDKETDVLSFPMLDQILPFTKANYPYGIDQDGRVLLGSIVVCRQVAQANSTEYGHSLSRELCFLFVHGLLHLLGFDHETDGQRAEMRIKEEEILLQIGEVR